MIRGFCFVAKISAFSLLVAFIVAPFLLFTSFADEKKAPAGICTLTAAGSRAGNEATRAVKKEGDRRATDLTAATRTENISTAVLAQLVAAAVSGGANPSLQP